MSFALHISGKHELSGPVALDDRRSSYERLAQVLDSVIWWTALGLIPLVAIPHGADKLWWQAAFECGVFGLGALWIVNGFFRGNWPLKGGAFFIPLLMLAGYAFLQTLPLMRKTTGGIAKGNGQQSISADVYGTYHFLAELLALIVLAKLLLDYTRERRRLAWLVYVVIGVGVGSAAFGVIRMIVLHIQPGQGYEFAQFANRNYFALMLEMALGLGLGLVLGAGMSRQGRLLHIALVLLLAITIVFTTSRGGILAMLGQILFLAIWFVIGRFWLGRGRSKEKVRSRWHLAGKLLLSVLLICGLAMILVFGIVNLGGEILTSRIEKLPAQWGNKEDRIQGERGDIWRATLRLVRANPLTGIGFGAYQTAIPRYHDASGKETPSSAHNDYLNLMAGGGLIGTGLATWFLIILMLRIREGLKSKDPFRRAASLGGLGGLFGVAVHSLVDTGLQVPVNAVIFFALMMIAASESGAKDNRPPVRA